MYLGATEPRVIIRQQIEKLIVEQAIDELLEQGFWLSVNDGEEESEITNDRAKVIDAIMNTDNDYLNVHQCSNPPQESIIGWVSFVYGNDGYDVMSDYTTNLEDHLKKTQALANKIEAGEFNIVVKQ